MMKMSTQSRSNLARTGVAGAIALMPALFDDAPTDAFNLNIYFDRAIASGRLYGIVMSGQWLTVGTPEAIGEAIATALTAAKPKVRYVVSPSPMQVLMTEILPKRTLDRITGQRLGLLPEG